MRVDRVLKYLCLAKSRSLAARLCGAGRVFVDGIPVRASCIVRSGHRITVHFDRHSISIVIRDVPGKQLSKPAALEYYERMETPPSDRLAGPDTETLPP